MPSLRISVSQVFSNLKLTAIPTECRGATENHKGLCTGLHCLLRALKKKEKRREEGRSEEIFYLAIILTLVLFGTGGAAPPTLRATGPFGHFGCCFDRTG